MHRYLCAGLLLAAIVLVTSGGIACKSGGNKPTAATVTKAATTLRPPTSVPQGTGTPLARAFGSYHYTVNVVFTVNDPNQPEAPPMSGMVEGDFVAPDSHAFTNTVHLAGISSNEKVVIIGERAWHKDGDSAWRATTRSDNDVQSALGLTSADPGVLQDPVWESTVSSLSSEPDPVNGVAARRYRIPKEAVDALSQLLGDGFPRDTAGLLDFDMTVWLEQETLGLVRAELTATGPPEAFEADVPFTISSDSTATMEIVINLTQINSDGISIEPPI